MSVSIIECDCGVMMVAFTGGGPEEAAMARRLAAKGDGLAFVEAEGADEIACPSCGREHDVYDGEFVDMRPASSGP
jgi:hypothetical protein